MMTHRDFPLDRTIRLPLRLMLVAFGLTFVVLAAMVASAALVPDTPPAPTAVGALPTETSGAPATAGRGRPGQPGPEQRRHPADRPVTDPPSSSSPPPAAAPTTTEPQPAPLSTVEPTTMTVEPTTTTLEPTTTTVEATTTTAALLATTTTTVEPTTTRVPMCPPGVDACLS
jgi:hypothetical protein